MARSSSIVAALALCLLLSCAASGYARGLGLFRSRIQASHGHGSGGYHGRGQHGGNLIYNSKSANGFSLGIVGTILPRDA